MEQVKAGCKYEVYGWMESGSDEGREEWRKRVTTFREKDRNVILPPISDQSCDCKAERKADQCCNKANVQGSSLRQNRACSKAGLSSAVVGSARMALRGCCLWKRTLMRPDRLLITLVSVPTILSHCRLSSST